MSYLDRQPMKVTAASLFNGDVIKRHRKVLTIATIAPGIWKSRVKMLATYTNGETDVLDMGRRVTVLASDFGGMATPFDCRVAS